jgi:hypothetical protein
MSHRGDGAAPMPPPTDDNLAPHVSAEHIIPLNTPEPVRPQPQTRNDSANQSQTSSIHSTPFGAQKVTNGVDYNAREVRRGTTIRDLLSEMTGKFAGLMPVQDFLKEFLPCDGTAELSPEQLESLSTAPCTKPETMSYPHFVSNLFFAILYFIRLAVIVRSLRLSLVVGT